MDPVNHASEIVCQVEAVIAQARQNAAVAGNHELLRSYWQIGKLIAGMGQAHGDRQLPERTLTLWLSKILAKEFGKGFSRRGLVNMKRFYENYASGRMLYDRTSWMLYCKLLGVPDEDAQDVFERLNSRWAIRDLRRQADNAIRFI